MNEKLTITQFAFKLGATKRMTMQASLPFHKAYVRATDVQQAQLRREWMLGYIAGLLDVSEKTSERILSEGKGKDSKNTPDQIKAIDAASTNFREHVVRKDAGESNAKKTRISAEERAAFEKFVKACGSVERALEVANSCGKKAK